ncbi:MAG TPA: hypothetical protein VMY37_16280 [Thermoguttaceae bacterium]|nr:hypothetical protein [Thermoguttaceae bacterium]
MTAVTILAWLTTCATVAVVFLTMRKVWWAPIAGLLHEGLWIAFALTSEGGWPIMFAAMLYAIVYAISIPKWWRERQEARP